MIKKDDQIAACWRIIIHLLKQCNKKDISIKQWRDAFLREVSKHSVKGPDGRFIKR